LTVIVKRDNVNIVSTLQVVAVLYFTVTFVTYVKVTDVTLFVHLIMLQSFTVV